MKGERKSGKNLKHHSGHKGTELKNPNCFQQRAQALGQNCIRNNGIPEIFLWLKVKLFWYKALIILILIEYSLLQGRKRTLPNLYFTSSFTSASWSLSHPIYFLIGIYFQNLYFSCLIIWNEEKSNLIFHGLVSRIITADQREFSSLLLKRWDDIHFLHHMHQYDAEETGAAFIISKCLQFVSTFQSIHDTLGSRFISVGGLDLRLSHFRVNPGPYNSVKIVCHLWKRLAWPSGWAVSVRDGRTKPMACLS